VKHESSSLKGKGGLYISGRVPMAADLRKRILSRRLAEENLKSQRDLLELVVPSAPRNLLCPVTVKGRDSSLRTE
jgi:hypothetical protein